MAKLQNIELLNTMIEQGYVLAQKHPVLDITILNYSKSCVLGEVWNEITEQCRGLIVDSDYNIISRPFPKFFNYEEIKDKNIIPEGGFEVFDKLDGSLGISYIGADGFPSIATRGSFVSEQAQHATHMLRTKYAGFMPYMSCDRFTYLFEIIYPENHIVVNYGNMDDIVLLAVIDNEVGKDVDLRKFENAPALGGPSLVTRYDGITDYTTIRDKFSGENKEGFVIKFESGFRMKMKFEEYFRIHFLLCRLSNRRIIDCLRFHLDQDLNDIMVNLDEENRLLLTDKIEDFKQRYNVYEEAGRKIYEGIQKEWSPRDTAEYILSYKRPYSSIAFDMKNGKDYEDVIWKAVREDVKEKPEE